MRNNFDVLIRVLDAPTSFGVGGGYTDDDDVSSILTEDERFRLREVITHDVQIKKFLQVTSNFRTIPFTLNLPPKFQPKDRPRHWEVTL